MPVKIDSALLTYGELSARSGVPQAKLRRMVAARQLRCIRLGHRTVRFRWSDFLVAAEKHTLEAHA